MNLISTQFTLKTQSLELYTAGCDGACEGCFSEETWDWEAGKDYKLWLDSIDIKVEKFDVLIKWIWLLGGEPLLNSESDLLELLQKLTSYNTPIMLFTRFELENVPESIKKHCDYIKTGKFDIYNLGTTEYYGVELQSLNQKIWRKEEDKWI